MVECTIQLWEEDPEIRPGAPLTLTHGEEIQGRWQIVAVTMERALAWDFSRGWPGVLRLCWLYAIQAAPYRLPLSAGLGR